MITISRTCLGITIIPCEENETAEEVLKKVKILINEEADVNIPVTNINRAHCVGPMKSCASKVFYFQVSNSIL